jgi:hypothetical protein
MSRFLQLVMTAAFAATLAVGCASHTTQTETVTASRNTPAGANASVERRTTTTERTDSDQHSGVMSNTVNTVGDVIAYPFRVVGGAIRSLF